MLHLQAGAVSHNRISAVGTHDQFSPDLQLAEIFSSSMIPSNEYDAGIFNYAAAGTSSRLRPI